MLYIMACMRNVKTSKSRLCKEMIAKQVILSKKIEGKFVPSEFLNLHFMWIYKTFNQTLIYF